MSQWKTAGKVRMTPRGTWSSTTAYNVLDLVSNPEESAFYIAKSSVPAGTVLTNTTYWNRIINIDDLIDIIAPAYENLTFPVSIGEYCIYNGSLYTAKQQIDTSEAWTQSHWKQVTVDSVFRKIIYNNSIYSDLTNSGIYTIKPSDLESGYWAYSTPTISTERLRNIRFIPVRNGMTIRYTNPTLKVYFGVLETESSISYLQTSGWIAAGSANAEYAINNDGYLVFLVESTTDIVPTDYDCTVSIVTSAKNTSDKAGDNLSLAWEQGGYDASGAKTTSAKRIRTPLMTLPSGNYIVRVNTGYTALLLEKGATSSKLLGSSVTDGYSFVFATKSNTQYALVLRNSDTVGNPNIYADEGENLTLEVYSPQINIDETGFFNMEWHKGVLLTQSGMASLAATSSASNIIPIPKGGINIYCDSQLSDSDTYVVYFFHKNDRGEFEPDEDYQYSMTDWSGSTPVVHQTKVGAYFPYAEGVYFEVVSVNTTMVICTGIEPKNYGRLTNLAPMTVRSQKLTIDGETVYKRDPTFWVHVTGEYVTPQILYGTVIRLQDAAFICCSAQYTLSAWIYDGDLQNENDYDAESGTYIYNKDNHLVDSIYGKPFSGTAVTGLTYIDLSQYGKKGYAVIAIHDRHTVHAGTNITARDEETHGGFRSHDDVLDNVFVGYYNHVYIEHAKDSNPIFFDNLRSLKTTTFPDTPRYRWRGPYVASRHSFPAMKSPTLGYYTGAQEANVPLANVSLKSYATACQNPCSNMYIAEWKQWTVAPSGSAINSKYANKAFGGICANLPPLMCGIEWFARGENFYNYPDGWNGFKIIRNFDPVTQADELKPGDWLYGCLPDCSDYHVVVVTDVISINGEIVCIESIEAYMPLWRYRVGWLAKPFTSFNMEFSKNEPLESYFNMVVRPPKSIYRRWSDVWDTSTDYTVGTLMCNRGTDSVYCEGDQYLYVTIADPNTTSIDVKKDGVTVETIVLANRELIQLSNISDLYSIDMIEDIRTYGAGYYTLTPNYQSEPQESFYVPETPDLSQEIVTQDGQQVAQITIPNANHMVYACLWYKPDNEYDYDYEELTTEELVYDEETDTWITIIVPFSGGGDVGAAGQRARIMHLPSELHDIVDNVGILTAPTVAEKGNTTKKVFYYNYCDVVYKTPYGTFVARCDNDHLWCSSDSNGAYQIR